jgi:hypothetical protein
LYIFLIRKNIELYFYLYQPNITQTKQ